MMNSCPGISYLLISASCAALVACNDATPLAETVSHVQLSSARVARERAYTGKVTDAARQYALEQRAGLRLSPHTDFEVRRVHERDRLTHVRLRQTHRGLRVWGAEVVVHATAEAITSMNGHVITGLDELDAEIRFDDADAVRMARADYTARAGAPASAYKRETIELMVYKYRGEPRLVWHVHFFTERQPTMEPGRWNYFIDATSGELLGAFDWLTTAPLQASGPGGNPNVARTWEESLDVEPYSGQYAMDTTGDVDINQPTVHGMITQDWKMSTNPGQASVVVGQLEYIGDASTADAHGFTEVTLDMMWQWMGHDSIDDAGYVIRSRVHYDYMYENAFWDGSQMTYGDGAQYFYPLTGDIDVIAHEINHGFTEHHSNLIYDQESGGLNESFSDVAGVAAEWFHEGTGADWLIGHDIARPGALPGDALRFMCDPPLDGVSIDHYDDYYPGIDVHFSSGIANKAFCRAAGRLSDPVNHNPATPPTVAGVQLAAQVWYEANASYWTPSTTFQDGCQGTIEAARDALGLPSGDVDAILASWNEVGVYCDGQTPPLRCDVIHTGDSGIIQSPNYPGNYPDQWSFTDCIYPSSGNIPTLTFTDFLTEEDWDFLYISDGSTGMEISTHTGATLPGPTTAPIIVVKFASDQSITQRGWQAEWTSVGNNTAPAASFTYNVAGLDVAFTDTSADTDGTIAEWAWDFGDGAISDQQNPGHAYAAEGTYTVTLTVTDDAGGWNSTSQQVTVVEPTGMPVASFDVSVSGRTVELTDTSIHTDGSIVGWSWDFGDGESSSEQHPSHTYATAGDYTITLTVTGTFGLTDTATAAVTVTSGGGCCDSGGQGEPPWAALIVVVGLLAMRRRRVRAG